MGKEEDKLILSVTCPEGHHHQYGKLCIEISTSTFIYWCPICDKTTKTPIVIVKDLIKMIEELAEKEVKDAKNISSSGGDSSGDKKSPDSGVSEH